MAKHKSHYARKTRTRLLAVYNPETNRPVRFERVPQGTCYEILAAKCYRNLATQNERVQNCGAQQDGYRVRGKRRAKHLPTAWDDRGVSRWRVRSWKDGTRCRKQWEPNLV